MSITIKIEIYNFKFKDRIGCIQLNIEYGALMRENWNKHKVKIIIQKVTSERMSLSRSVPNVDNFTINTMLFSGGVLSSSGMMHSILI